MTSEELMIFTTPAILYAMNQSAIERYTPDERSEMIRPGCLDQCIGNAVTAACYASSSDKPDLLHYAVYLYRYLVLDHCFFGGNKRTGWMCLARSLLLCGLEPGYTEIEAHEFTVGVVEHHTSFDEILAWLMEPDRLIAAS